MSSEPIIQLKNVNKTFGTQHVLRGTNLSISEGKTTVIVGGSGQGKSVIIKHILGLIQPDDGEVLVYGKDINRISKKELREIRTNFGVLFQSAALFDSMTVFDNVALPLRERTKKSGKVIADIVNENLALMDIVGSNEKYPAQISGGMKKRVGLARALVLNPKIVFFDEPTTGLDVAKSNEIYRVFFKSQAQLGYTAVIVSHDVPKIFKLADYVALLYQGQVQDYLTPEEFQLSDDPIIRTFVETTMGQLYSSKSMEGE
ncbi:MAG TPA: ATP-binding cassette domain-containing protein [Nitrospirae bacterium]|nr:putative phospholipid import ATP-binding protein MlaF [bacterium BMS3Abin10]GBE39882.1 putative phospholipid import ATP-binding protein MlaF [bacterium BMS3Bbin08]HDH50870.1 ATP-binding cassette domain-containing protein [Nitrospirota bacterium]HDK16990.1 ATP-binding cassette domain-containing protein [Nitrospirota bacterium]HDK82440.1 ATP-binding cassette domain-containing protein [Nitrospirota bacterium]